MPGVPDLWLKLATPQPQLRGVDQAKALLAQIPHGDYLWRNFKTVCDAGLGQALHWLGRPPVARSTAAVEQFGTAPRKPAVSIIVPLYGRWDFMRHQLAQFCKDPDFAKVDLIYVVDDPGIHAAVLADASHYQPLFQIPFRVVTYAENRGFAGANNSAVPFARAPLLLLLNSDVLPQQPGWLQTLRRAYTRLPQCGMVGPLLQFPEGSVQHAGMAATRQSNNPGLVFSHHPGKGGAWEGGNTPSEQPLLTGACLLLSKQDYQAAGGLDEDYLVGDFEDSDFSLRLRALGKRLYLVPAARLWHLERQSQYLGNNATAVRDMLTLYNAWRYHNKIAAGTLPDPERS
jgi:GT2 family glycosyltransferase